MIVRIVIGDLVEVELEGDDGYNPEILKDWLHRATESALEAHIAILALEQARADEQP